MEQSRNQPYLVLDHLSLPPFSSPAGMRAGNKPEIALSDVTRQTALGSALGNRQLQSSFSLNIKGHSKTGIGMGENGWRSSVREIIKRAMLLEGGRQIRSRSIKLQGAWSELWGAGSPVQGSESCRTSAGIGWRWVQSRRRETGPHTSADTAELWSSATCQPLTRVQKLVRQKHGRKINCRAIKTQQIPLLAQSLNHNFPEVASEHPEEVFISSALSLCFFLDICYKLPAQTGSLRNWV